MSTTRSTTYYSDLAISTGRIQLLSLATPNGQKIAAALEELGLPYDPHTINISKNEQFAPEFLDVSPNNKIPAIVDPRVPFTVNYPPTEKGQVTVALGYEGFKNQYPLTHGVNGWSRTVYVPIGKQFVKFFVEGTLTPHPQLEVVPNEGNRITVTGTPVKLFESGAILIHLAETTGKLLPEEYHARLEALKWLFWQVGGVGPMFGQYNHFNRFAKEKIPYAIERYETESKRLLGVLEKHLESTGKEFIVGNEYTIADIASWPWVNVFSAAEFFQTFPRVKSWVERCVARPASQKAKTVTPFS